MRIRDRSTLDLFDSRHSNAGRSTVAAWLDPDEPIADNFAGGGGAKLGIEQALAELGITDRRAIDVAVNHWPAALAMYRANHPRCAIHCEDITKVDPVAASGGRRYALAWFSPTCIFFSQARGGALDAEEATKVRGLANIMVDWARSKARPRVGCLENVKQFRDWGPLHRQHGNGCSAEIAAARGTADRKGKVAPKCLKGCSYGRPIKSRRGEFFNAFLRDLRGCYRYVEFRVLKAHHYGAPTSRERFFLIASDEPVSWPEPTHGPGRVPYRTAAECIDWTIECPSIFERAKALAAKTLARIRAGIERFVFGAARPFIVPTSYGDKGGADVRTSSADEPLRTIAGNRSSLNVVSPLVMKAKTYGGGGNDAHPAETPLGTITTSKRGEHAVAAPMVVRSGMHMSNALGVRPPEEPLATITTDGGLAIATPYLVHRGNGERVGQTPRIYDPGKPIGTIVAQGEKHAVVAPVLVKNYSEREGGFAGGQPINRPAGTITQRDHHSIAAVSMTKLRGTSDSHVEASSGSPDEPLPTVSASGTHHSVSLAYLIRYNGTSGPANANEPLSTIDTRDRFALVELQLEREVCEKAMRVAAFLGYEHPIVLEIDGVEWVLVDIGFRMLVALELFLCQGFPRTYRIDVDHNGKPLTKTAQIKCVGNSVPPPLAAAVAMAAILTIRYEPELRRAA